MDSCTVIDKLQLLNSTSYFSRSVLDSHWNPLAGATSGYLTQQTVGYLKRQGFNIIYIWEHEWAVMAKSDRELPKLLATTKMCAMLIPIDTPFCDRKMPVILVVTIPSLITN